MADYVRTAAANDTVALLLKKIDQVLSAYASLKSSHATLVGKYNTLATKLNADTGVADIDYAANATDSSSAAPSTAQSELM